LVLLRYRLSSESDGSSSEDERYDIREVMIFSKATDSDDVPRGRGIGGSGEGVSKEKQKEGGELSEVGVAEVKCFHGDMAGSADRISVGQSSDVDVAKGEEDPVEGESSSAVTATEEDPHRTPIDKEGAGEGEAPRGGQSSGVSVAEEEDPYEASTDEEVDDGEGT
jgi:hypothetical protein